MRESNEAKSGFLLSKDVTKYESIKLTNDANHMDREAREKDGKRINIANELSKKDDERIKNIK